MTRQLLSVIRVLVVDDHEVIRDMVSSALCAAADIDVIARCVDGLEACGVAASTRPDVVLMDLSMPGAARHGQSARDLNPLDELGWQLVIETQWLDGHRSDALRSFNIVRSLLERALGIAPCSALQQLYVQVLYDEPLAQSA
jgi:two-component SAPR family response regulator